MKLISENVIYNEQDAIIQYFKAIHILKTLSQLAKCNRKSIAEMMVKYKIGSVVEENRLPIGIITDKDLRSKIATGMFAINDTGPNYVSTGNTVPQIDLWLRSNCL
jgi:CBS domain-containing protein